MGTIKLTEYADTLVKKVCASFDNEEGELINILHKIQEEAGYLPAELQELIAKQLRIPVAKVYGVVTFYSFFTMRPQGQFPISVCMGTACYVRGAEKLVDELKRNLKIEVGQTTPDGKFSLSCLRCVGACGLAPVVMVGNKVYGRVDQKQIRNILDEYKEGKFTAPKKHILVP